MARAKEDRAVERVEMDSLRDELAKAKGALKLIIAQCKELQDECRTLGERCQELEAAAPARANDVEPRSQSDHLNAMLLAAFLRNIDSRNTLGDQVTGDDDDWK